MPHRFRCYAKKRARKARVFYGTNSDFSRLFRDQHLLDALVGKALGSNPRHRNETKKRPIRHTFPSDIAVSWSRYAGRFRSSTGTGNETF
jgi:hypothetical protein